VFDVNEAAESNNAGMDPKSAIAALLARVEELTTTNAALKKENATLRREHEASRSVRYLRRPGVLRGRTVQTNVGCGPLYITLNEDERGQPFEVFFKLGKSGSCQQSYLEALGVAMSVGLRYGADPQKYIEKFQGMRCPNPRMRDASGPTTFSCADGISQGLTRALELTFAATELEPQLALDATTTDVGVVPVAEPTYRVEPQVTPAKGGAFGAGLCPKCRAGSLVRQSGCETCPSCGYERCG